MKGNKMKILKKSMRLWITIASLFSFLAGWALFSHSNKPAPLQVNQPAITVPVSNQPTQYRNYNTQPSWFPFSGLNQSPYSQPRLRTGGS
jgi:hypothetical protein